jgi:Fe-S-cluster-containing dehydrogenase component
MVIDPAACLHCGACVIACKAENAVPDGRSRNRLVARETGTFPDLHLSLEPWQCMHCATAPCVQVCPTGASYRAADGTVQVNPDDCIGCRYCMEACPYDARYFDDVSGTVDKCTFCTHRAAQGREPACVETCPTRARVFGDAEDPSSGVARLLAAQPFDVRLPRAETQPSVYYLREE